MTVRVAVPLQGKMACRSFHTEDFIQALNRQEIDPVFYVPGEFLEGLDPNRYHELKIELYKKLYRKPIRRLLSEVRRFIIRTDTTEVKFLDFIQLLAATSNHSSFWVILYVSVLETIRQMRFAAPAFRRLENLLTQTAEHQADLRATGISSVLTPGMGSFGFLNPGLFALEAQRLKIPVVSSISNYDNILNRGYPCFIPEALGVWSAQMEEDAVRLLRIPRERIHVTGAVQFDRYAHSPAVSREEYLRSRGLDPQKKTVFFAGTLEASQYLEWLQMIRVHFGKTGIFRDCNVVLRPMPNEKLMSWIGIDVISQVLAEMPNAYFSDPRKFSPENFMPIAGIATDVELDELHCLFCYSDVLINVYSTVALEAAILDLPTIHLNYQDYIPAHYSVAAYQRRQDHNKRPLRLAAARHPNNEAELLKCIEAYLSDHSLDRQARQDYAYLECGTVDGKAGQRLAQLLRQCAKAK